MEDINPHLLSYLIAFKLQMILWEHIYEKVNIGNPPNVPNLKDIRVSLITEALAEFVGD